MQTCLQRLLPVVVVYARITNNQVAREPKDKPVDW